MAALRVDLLLQRAAALHDAGPRVADVLLEPAPAHLRLLDPHHADADHAGSGVVEGLANIHERSPLGCTTPRRPDEGGEPNRRVLATIASLLTPASTRDPRHMGVRRYPRPAHGDARSESRTRSPRPARRSGRGPARGGRTRPNRYRRLRRR